MWREMLLWCTCWGIDVAMTIFEVLKADHDKASEHIRELEEITDTEARKERTQEAERELLAHMETEEEIIYPLLEEDEKGKELMNTAEEEHEAIREALIGATEAAHAGERWGETVQVLWQNVDRHAAREEDVIFAALRNKISESEAKKLGEKFSAVRDEKIDIEDDEEELE